VLAAHAVELDRELGDPTKVVASRTASDNALIQLPWRRSFADD
jgi:hypothetical protein